MKKIFILLFITLMCSFTLTGCQNKTNDDDIIVFNISLEAKQYLKDYVEVDGAKQILSEGNFEIMLDYLYNREDKQVLPAYDVENTVDSFICAGSNVYTLTHENYENIILYIHGGAWAFEISQEHIDICDKLATYLNAKVYMPLYPLTPKYNSDDTYQMIESLYKEILKSDKDIYLMGDSAGGNIALGLAYTIKEEKLAAPKKMILIAPCSDMSFTNEEMKEYEEIDPELSIYGASKLAKLWAGEGHLKDPKNSAVYADLSDYPDTLIFQGTNDILCPDNLLLYEHMKEDGVNVTLVKGEGLWHVFPIYPIPEQEKALDIIKDFCLDD